jgi:hypothetical protein
MLALTAPAAMAENRQVRIINATGQTMVWFYSTNTGAIRRGNDILGSTTLESCNAVRMNFDNSKGYRVFDFRTIFEDGTEAQRQGINVCEVGEYTYQP